MERLTGKIILITGATSGIGLACVKLAIKENAFSVIITGRNEEMDIEVLKELGDVLFYVTALSNIFGGNLRKTMEMNMEKLDDREQRGVLKGSGDNR